MARLSLRNPLVIALLVTASACSDSAGDDNTLFVYSGRHYDVEKAFEQFETETGIDVEFLTGNDAELRERIESEGEDTEADVYLTVDAGNLAAAAEDGLFQPLESPTLDEVIDERYRDDEGRWYALALRARTIIFNPEMIDEADVPTTYEELAEPEWKGRVCLRNAANGYQQSLVASLIAQHGRDEALRIVEGWASNAEIFANDVEIIEAVDAGECEVAVANHYYLARAIDESPELAVDLLWANQGAGGTHVNISGGGITKYANQPDLARRFLEWLGTDGQKVLVDGNFELPANTTLEPVALVVDEFGVDFERQQISATEIGRLNPDAVEVMDEAGFG